MNKWIKYFCMVAALGVYQICTAGQILKLTIQEKVRQSDMVVIAAVKDIKAGKIFDKTKQQWIAECDVQLVLKGDIFIHRFNVGFVLPVGVEIKPKPVALSANTNYLLFLKRGKRGYELITSYHGAIPESKDYSVIDEDLKDDKEALRKSSSSINGLPAVLLAHEELIAKIQKLVCPEALEHLAMESPVTRSGREVVKVPENVNRILIELRSEGRTDHFPYLLEYGLNIYLKNLKLSKLARELPVKENLPLSELTRIAKIAKYATAHEAGWLNNQFMGSFEQTGYSSYQIYIWYLEHFGSVCNYPNMDRLSEIDKQITATGSQGLGGGRVCHYECM